MNTTINFIQEHELMTFFIVIYFIGNSYLTGRIAEYNRGDYDSVLEYLSLHTITLILGLPIGLIVYIIICYRESGLNLYFRASSEDRSEYDMSTLNNLIVYAQIAEESIEAKKQKTILDWCSIACHKRYIKYLHRDIETQKDRVLNQK